MLLQNLSIKGFSKKIFVGFRTFNHEKLQKFGSKKVKMHIAE